VKKLLYYLLYLLILIPSTTFGWGITTTMGIGTSLPGWSWSLESSLVPTTGSIVGIETYAGTNRTRVNPDTGFVESVGANVARFEEVGGYKGVLIEPASTNFFLNSPGFGSWIGTRASVSTNITTAPDGTNTASKLVVDGTPASDHSLYHDIVHTSFTNNAKVTYSFYVKSAEYSWVFLNIATKTPAYPYIYFNTTTGAVGSETVDSYGSEDVGDGWWRVWLTHNIGTGVGTTRWTIYPAESNGDITINGDSSSGIYIWGPQVEQSPIPTSLIYTTGTAGIRATEAGEPHFALPSGLFDDKGTAIVWWRPGFSASQGDGTARGIVGTRNSSLSLIYCDADDDQIKSYDGDQTPNQTLAWSANTWYKLVVKWNYDVAGTAKFRVGVDSGSGVSWGSAKTWVGPYAIATHIKIGHSLFSRMHLRQLSLFPTVLSDAQIDSMGSP
jgi:hypothetical protein